MSCKKLLFVPAPSGAVCLTRGAFLWLGAEHLFLHPARCEKETTSLQCFREARWKFTAAESSHVSKTFQLDPPCREDAPENSSAPPRRTRPRDSYCFLLPYYQGREGNGSLTLRTRRETIYAGEALRFFPPPQLPGAKIPRSSLSAAAQQPEKPSVIPGAVGVDIGPKFGTVCLTLRLIRFLVFAHLPPPFRFCASLLLPGCCMSAPLYNSVYCRNDSARAVLP